MKRQRTKLANDNIRTYHYNTRSSSRHANKRIAETASKSVRVTSFDLLPTDLIMEILKRLSIKTLGRILCVSNLWASIIRSKDFMKLFLFESSSRPGCLFFSFDRERNDILFSSLKALNPGESSIATTYHLTHRSNDTYRISSSCVHGLICYANASGSRLVIYNSSTRRSVTLPEFEPGSFVSRHFLGYDPIDGVYKVLCMTGPSYLYHVLTLGNGSSWKMIENYPVVHMPANSQIICINGVVYYEALSLMDFTQTMVVSFDVRCENFQVIKKPAATTHLFYSMFSTLIRYEGKLAILSTELPANGSVELWVLEDTVKHKWLKKVFVLPNTGESLAESTSVEQHTLHRSVNITDAGELILAPRHLSDSDSPYYVICYDPKRNSVRKVVIEGIKEHELLQSEEDEICILLCIYSGQAESLMFL